MVEEDEVVIGGGAAAAIVPATAAVTQAVAPAAAISYACTVCASSETYDGNPIVMCDGALSVFWIIFCAMKPVQEVCVYGNAAHLIKRILNTYTRKRSMLWRGPRSLSRLEERRPPPPPPSPFFFLLFPLFLLFLFFLPFLCLTLPPIIALGVN